MKPYTIQTFSFQAAKSLFVIITFFITKPIMSRKSPKPKTFEDALTRLQEITKTMQYNELSLDESLAIYQEGIELLQFCYAKLNTAEQQLRVLDEIRLKEFKIE